MSILIPETNAEANGNAGAVALAFPAGASFKPANRGFMVGIFLETPVANYEANANHTVLCRGTGNTGTADGYLRFNQAASQLTAIFKNGGSNLFPSVTLSAVPNAGKRILIMLIATANDTYVVACEAVAGATAIYAKNGTASTGIYTTNLSASDCWTRIGPGNSASKGHYGAVEEAFFILGEFPEVSGGPDLTLVQAIADGTQDIATLHTATGVTNGTKKWRYRMLQQDMLTDAFGLAGNLNPINTDANKVLLSGGPLRPNTLRPTYGRRMASQVTFGTPGDASTARANIAIEGGTYTGISPAKIEARIRKEDGSVLVAYQTVDAAPAAGAWQGTTFTNVPGTAGWLTCDFRAVDGSGVQIGDLISSYQIKGAGFSFLLESQSQGYYFVAQGSGITPPSDIRLCAIFLGNAGALPFRIKTPTSGNTGTRLARGAVQSGIEFHTIYSKWPVSYSTIAITGQSLASYLTGNANAFTWAAFKSFVGTVQPYHLYMFGHGSLPGLTVDQYTTNITDAVAKATADIAAPLKVVHGQMARYADTGGAQLTQNRTSREGTRKWVYENPTGFFAGSFNHLKCDTGDTGPHPMDGNVGQGRGGAGVAWGVMQACRAVEDQPLTITAATLLSGGTVLELTLDKVNA